MRFAPEGRPFFLIGGLILLGFVAAAWKRGGAWCVPLALWLPVTAWLLVFFRNPLREGPRGDRLVIAPADGRVVSVLDLDEPAFVRGRATRVSIFMTIFDVHVNRHPVSGIVKLRDYRPGRFVNATFDKASEANERMSLGVLTPHGPVLVRQIAGLIARRIVTDPGVGDSVRQGERLGMIRFGSRVDTFLPPGARVRVRVGDLARAGVTVIAEWAE